MWEEFQINSIPKSLNCKPINLGVLLKMELHQEIQIQEINRFLDTLSETQRVLKRAIEAQQVCISDIHTRLNSLETQLNNDPATGHKFYSKDHAGCYLVRCNKTNGSFSTALWKLERIKKNVCPCCGETIKKFEK